MLIQQKSIRYKHIENGTCKADQYNHVNKSSTTEKNRDRKQKKARVKKKISELEDSTKEFIYNATKEYTYFFIICKR